MYKYINSFHKYIISEILIFKQLTLSYPVIKLKSNWYKGVI